MKRTFSGLLMLFILGASSTQAMALDPLSFSSFGNLNTSGPITINTDTLQLNVNGESSFTGIQDAATNKALFVFDDIQTAEVTVQGSHSLALLSKVNATFNGPFSLLGSGGLEIGTTGSLSLGSLTANGMGGDVVLHGNNISLSDPILAFDRTLAILSETDISMPLGGTSTNSDSHNDFRIIGGDITITGTLSESDGIAIRGTDMTIEAQDIIIPNGGTITVSSVPLPPASILFIAGLLVLVLIRQDPKVLVCPS